MYACTRLAGGYRPYSVFCKVFVLLYPAVQDVENVGRLYSWGSDLYGTPPHAMDVLCT